MNRQLICSELEGGELSELQKILLGILVDVNNLCSKYKIPFYLGEGTLLGAVRHHGFIPWDDDIDIYMKRSDYERFFSIAKEELAEKYEIQHPSTIKHYWSTFIKVRLINGEIKFAQKHIIHLTDHFGPCIDVFPLEYVNSNDSLLERIQSVLIKTNRWMIMYKLKAWPISDLKSLLLSLGGYVLPYCFLQNTAQKAYILQGTEKKDFLAAFSTYHPFKNIIWPSDCFKESCYMKFENYDMPVPVGYDQILRSLYGNYMELPPVEKRISGHQYCKVTSNKS